MGQQSNKEVMIAGMYLLAAKDIFNMINNYQEYNDIFVDIAFYEIYCGKLFDLLNDRNQLHAREDNKQNVNIVGLVEKRVVNV